MRLRLVRLRLAKSILQTLSHPICQIQIPHRTLAHKCIPFLIEYSFINTSLGESHSLPSIPIRFALSLLNVLRLPFRPPTPARNNVPQPPPTLPTSHSIPHSTPLSRPFPNVNAISMPNQMIAINFYPIRQYQSTSISTRSAISISISTRSGNINFYQPISTPSNIKQYQFLPDHKNQQNPPATDPNQHRHWG
jgi:hypothetical protein